MGEWLVFVDIKDWQGQSKRQSKENKSKITRKPMIEKIRRIKQRKSTTGEIPKEVRMTENSGSMVDDRACPQLQHISSHVKTTTYLLQKSTTTSDQLSQTPRHSQRGLGRSDEGKLVIISRGRIF